METESLANFLAPNNIHLTVEGYPAPLRATLVAKKINMTVLNTVNTLSLLIGHNW